MLALTALLFVGCNQRDEKAADSVSASDPHQAVVEKFQTGQERFKELIATVRDEQSFDIAKPELDKVVSDWRDVASALSELESPSSELQSKLRALIAEGHRATEPTGEGMLSLISIESREAVISQWLEDFVAAGGAAGAEMTRLYGPVDYADSSNTPPKIEPKFVQVGGGTKELSFDWIESDSGLESTTAEQGGADQPATAPESKSESEEKPKPESEGRSQ